MIETNYPWRLFVPSSPRHLLSYLKTLICLPHVLLICCTNDRFLFVDSCSQLVRCVWDSSSPNTSYHLPSSHAFQLGTRLKQCVCVCLFARFSVCVPVFTHLHVSWGLWTKTSADIMLFGLCPVHLAQHLSVLPDPVNWCVSKWLTTPGIVPALSL